VGRAPPLETTGDTTGTMLPIGAGVTGALRSGVAGVCAFMQV
jgi:hypothetical protein